jgi:hypothetical protein
MTSIAILMLALGIGANTDAPPGWRCSVGSVRASGVVFVSPVDDAVRIRSGERGEQAL